MAAAGHGSDGFAPFVSRLAARWVADWPEERHRRLEGSLISADLSGFTALSERLAERGKRGAEDLTAMVNGCFTALIRAAALHGGDVLKFGGDALLVWFDGEDHPVRAARAAARMQRAIGAARFARAGLAMSVGAHTGAFDVFLVGRDDWRELVLAGEPVTTTVMLEAAAAAGEVLVSDALAARLPAAWLDEPAERGCRLAVEAAAGTGSKRASQRAADVEPAAAARLVAPSLQAHIAALAGTSGEHRLATVVFAELEGTDASVAADPGGFAASVDALVTAVEDLADRYGLLFLYTDVIADGVKLLAVAGAPTSAGDDEEAGLRFATELVTGDPRQKLRAGVNRGRVFAGFLGSEERRTYTVMGDPVNLSARLMGRAEPGQVLASDDMLRATRTSFAHEPVAPFLVKGKARPVTAHVIGPPTGRVSVSTVAALPLVGREEELAVLRDAIASATIGRGVVVELVGDAGIGKTRLIQAVADDPRFLIRATTECQPYDDLSPYAAVRPLLRRTLGIESDAAASEAGRQLVALADRVVRRMVPLLPLLGPALGADLPPTPEVDAIAPEFRQARMHDLVIDLLEAALPTTTLLVIEDIYYVDDASLQLLRSLARRVPERPWTMLATRRPEGPGLIVGEAPGILLKLQPLGPDVVGELARVATAGSALGTGDLEAISERAGGNPLFVLELVDATLSGVAADDLPESIERLVSTRVDRLAPDDRALLRNAAVAGRVFHTGVVNALLVIEGRARASAEDWVRLDEFVETEGPRRLRFRHALFRDVAYEGLPFARRRRAHRAIGEFLEAGVGGEPDPALLSTHFWFAGDAARTWRYSVEAADRAWSGLAVHEAIAAYQRALGVRRRVAGLDGRAIGAVAERAGDALERVARYDDALEAYRLARRAAGGDLPTGPRLLRKVGLVEVQKGRFASALRWYRRARAMLAGAIDGAREQADVDLAFAAACHRLGRHREMAEWAERASKLATEVGYLRAEGEAKNLLLVAALYGVGGAVEVGYEALEIFRSLDDPFQEAKVANNLGVRAYYEGDWTGSGEWYEQASVASRRAGDVAGSARALVNLGELLSDRGLLDQAEQSLEASLQMWSAARNGFGIAYVIAHLARLAAKQGHHDEAALRFAEAIERFEEMGMNSQALDTKARQAESLILGGDPVGAARTAEEVLGAARDGETEPVTGIVARRSLGWSLLQRHSAAAAAVEIDRALAEARASGLSFEIAESLRAAAAARHAVGDADGAGLAAEAEIIYSSLGVVRLVEVPLG